MTLPLLTAPPVAALLILLGCGGIRFQARLFALERQRDGKSTRLRTLIVGATDAGVALALELEAPHVRRLASSSASSTTTRSSSAARCAALRVLGTTHDLEARVRREKHRPRRDRAPRRVTRERRGEIEARALKTDAQVKVLAGPSDSAGEPLLNSLRDLDLTDLLGREHAPVDPSDIADYLEGADVLVTGAGGSIGSEIARQIAQYRPARLLLLDRDDSLLFEVVVVARQGRADPRRHPRRGPPARDLRAARARRRVPRRRAQARADPRVAPRRSGADQRARHVDARAGRGRPPLPARAHLHRQGRRPVLDHGREQARRRARGARRSATSTSSRSRPFASATCSAAAAAWCRPSSARSSRAVRSRSPTPR